MMANKEQPDGGIKAPAKWEDDNATQKVCTCKFIIVYTV
jgi:hypothetical protein